MTGTTELDRADLSQALGFIAQLGEAASNEALRVTVIGSLRALVPADSVTVTEIETRTGGASFWTDPREVGERGDTEAFVAHLDEHPIAAHHAANGGAEAVQFADFLSERALHALSLYNDFYRPLEVEHQLAIAVDAPGALSVPISVQSRDHAFDLRARTMLELLHPHLTRAYERVDAELRAAALIEMLERAESAAVVIVDRHGGIEFATGRARRWLASYLGAATEPGLLPTAVADRLAGWRARPGYDDASAASERRLLVRRPEGTLSVRYARVGETETLLLEEARRRPDPDRLRELGLTRREAEVLSVAAEGGTTDDLGERLVISPRTVKKHLENIYRKLGVGSRAEAVATAMGTDRASGRERL